MEVIKRSTDLAFGEMYKGPEITQEEKEIIRALVSSKSAVDICIPDDVDKDTLISWMNSAIKIDSAFGKAKERLRPVIGRMLHLISTRKDLQEHFGVKNISEFIYKQVPKIWGIVASQAWVDMRIAREYPHITTEQYESVGVQKLKMIAKVVPQEDGRITPAVAAKREKLMAAAPGLRYKQFAEYLEQEVAGWTRDQIIDAKITVKCDREMVEFWRKLKADKAVIDYVGSAADAAILRAALQEFYAAAQSYRLANE